MYDFINGIKDFNENRGLLDGYTKENEANMIHDELKEYYQATEVNDVLSELADLVIVPIGTMLKMGYDPEKVITEKVMQILSRDGEIDEETGKWEKFQHQPNIYQADFSKCQTNK